MNARRDPGRVRTDPPPYPPRHHDRNVDPWREVQSRADHDLAERTVQAIYTEGN